MTSHNDEITQAPASVPIDTVYDDKKLDDDDVDLREKFTYAQSKALLKRADWHILPILILLYLSKNMDGNLVSVSNTICLRVVHC